VSDSSIPSDFEELKGFVGAVDASVRRLDNRVQSTDKRLARIETAQKSASRSSLAVVFVAGIGAVASIGSAWVSSRPDMAKVRLTMQDTVERSDTLAQKVSDRTVSTVVAQLREIMIEENSRRQAEMKRDLEQQFAKR
jgi:hypothetical protein